MILDFVSILDFCFSTLMISNRVVCYTHPLKIKSKGLTGNWQEHAFLSQCPLMPKVHLNIFSIPWMIDNQLSFVINGEPCQPVLA